MMVNVRHVELWEIERTSKHSWNAMITLYWLLVFEWWSIVVKVRNKNAGYDGSISWNDAIMVVNSSCSLQSSLGQRVPVTLITCIYRRVYICTCLIMQICIPYSILEEYGYMFLSCSGFKPDHLIDFLRGTLNTYAPTRAFILAHWILLYTHTHAFVFIDVFRSHLYTPTRDITLYPYEPQTLSLTITKKKHETSFNHIKP